jgi:hypothetical protein
MVLGGGSSATFQQDGGIHNCAHQLSIEGDLRHFSARGASYVLNGGKFSTPTVSVNAYGSFSQSNGTTSVSGDFSFGGNFSAFYRWSSSLAGGTLASSNFQSAGIGADFWQWGGSLLVTNSFIFSGGVPSPNQGMGLPTYTFSGGTISASNIVIGAQFILQSSPVTGRITNPGSFKLAGTLRLGDASEQLGRFILANDSVIDLGPGSARLAFAGSAAETWSTNAHLWVTNWSGSLSGGGSDQLSFGSSASGLTSAQLRQLVFTNPAGFAAGNYPAQLLSTGEVVPGPRASLAAAHTRTNFVLSWPAGWTLQSSTNVVGPYLDISGATSPYTNQFTADPQRFFRLRR